MEVVNFYCNVTGNLYPNRHQKTWAWAPLSLVTFMVPKISIVVFRDDR